MSRRQLAVRCLLLVLAVRFASQYAFQAESVLSSPSLRSSMAALNGQTAAVFGALESPLGASSASLSSSSFVPPPCASRWDGPSLNQLAERLSALPMDQTARNVSAGLYPAMMAYANVCIHPLTDMLFGLGPKAPVGLPVSRSFLRGHLQAPPESFLDQPTVWLPGTTLQLSVMNQNIAHMFYDRVWPVLVHLATRKDSPPIDTVFIKGLYRPARTNVDAYDELGCAAAPFPWGFRPYSDFMARIVTVLLPKAKIVFHSDSFPYTSLCFERYEFALDTADRRMNIAPRPVATQVAQNFRAAVFDYIGIEPPQSRIPLLGTVEGTQPLRVLIYDRGDARTRTVENVAELVAAVKEMPLNLTINVISVIGDLSAPEQVRIFAETDIAIMPHGAHTTSAIFMANHTAFIEINSPCDSHSSWMKNFVPLVGIHWKWLEGSCTEKKSMTINVPEVIDSLEALLADIARATAHRRTEMKKGGQMKQGGQTRKGQRQG